MSEFVFAPVAIITLNRVEHLRRCIESLKQCKYAEKTELFLSVDFPPNESYIEGYEKVLSYLESDIDGFAKVHIYKQEKNLGVNGNDSFLKKKVFERFDRYISIEDDNEFSYNFLEYMDKGLSIFEKDDKILNICAVQEDGPWCFREDTIVFQQTCPAYALGCWREKEKKLSLIDNSYFLQTIPNSKQKINTLYEISRTCFQQYVEGVLWSKNRAFWKSTEELQWCDTIRSIYAICEGKCFITPKESKVRNFGFDGSGINTQKSDINPYDKWQLDGSEEIHYIYTYDKHVSVENTKYIDRYLIKTPRIDVIRAIVKLAIYILVKNRGKRQ